MNEALNKKLSDLKVLHNRYMARGMWGKIEWIREQPEHIRMRYVAGCLLVSMTFILGIWLLSLKESFQHTLRDVPAGLEKGKELLPDGTMPSLSNLLEQAKPLEGGGLDEKTGQQYFEEQFGAGSQKMKEERTGEQPAP